MAAEQSYLLGNKEFYVLAAVKAARTRAAHKILCAVLIPPTGKSSGTTLGVPFKALLHLQMSTGHSSARLNRFTVIPRLSIVYLSYIYRVSIVYLSCIYRVSIVESPRNVRKIFGRRHKKAQPLYSRKLLMKGFGMSCTFVIRPPYSATSRRKVSADRTGTPLEHERSRLE